jgi:hypothetical protein
MPCAQNKYYNCDYNRLEDDSIIVENYLLYLEKITKRIIGSRRRSKHMEIEKKNNQNH